jgi:hypothetical protein
MTCMASLPAALAVVLAAAHAGTAPDLTVALVNGLCVATRLALDGDPAGALEALVDAAWT